MMNLNVSLRVYLASQAMKAIIAEGSSEDDWIDAETAADLAFEYADALISWNEKHPRRSGVPLSAEMEIK